MLRAITLAVILICPAALVPAAAPSIISAPPITAQQQNAPQSSASPSPKVSGLQPQSRLELVRFVSGEFVEVVRPLPAGRHGFHYQPRESFSDAEWKKALAKHGAGIDPGEGAQITSLVFQSKEIAVEINGGGKHRGRLLDHVQVSAGAGGQGASTPPPAPVKRGGILVLEYKGGVPDMSADDLKRDLAPFLSFAGQHSAAVDWIETLPPEIKQAVADHRAVVGMNHEMVVAALGRPDKKVREHDADDNETEDWIYGEPPGKTIFVTFLGDKVTKVRQFPQ